MSAATLLAELQATFPGGQTSGTFDATAVAGGEYAPLLTGLGVPTTLSLTSPAGWRADGDDVVLDGTATTAVLGVAGAPVHLGFTAAGDDFVLMIDLQLPAGWTFGHSFPLLNAGIFKDLTLADPATSPSALILASGPAQDPLRTVAGAPLAVAKGLTFHGYANTNSSAITQIAWLITGGAEDAITGPIGFDPASGAVDMQLPLAKGGVSDLFGKGGPDLELELSLYSGLNPVARSYESGIRFDTTLAFATTDSASETIDLSALLVTSGDGVLEIGISGSALAFPTPATLASYFGPENGIADALPGQFSGGSLVEVSEVMFGIGLQSESLEYAWVTIGALENEVWRIWPGVIEVGDAVFSMAAFDPLGDDSNYEFTFGATLTLGDVPILLQGELPAEVFTGNLDPAVPPPSLVPLVQHVFGFTNDLPQELAITRLDLAADVGQSIYRADIVIDGDWEFDFGIDNQVVFEKLALSFEYASKTPAGGISGRFAVGANEFDVSFEMTSGNATFKGHWEDTGDPLTYQDIAIALGMYGLPNLPEGLDLELKSADFEFESAGPSFSFDVETASYGGMALVAGKDAAGAWGFVFGMVMGLDLKVELTDIDVIGKLVPAGDDVIALDDLRVVGATTALPAFTPTEAQMKILGDQVSSGIALSIDLQVGNALNDTFTVRFGGADDGSQYDVPPSGSGTALVAAAGDAPVPSGAAPGPQATWVSVQRAFGPVQIGRVGFTITPDSRLGLLLDASVSLAGLTIALEQLEADIELQSPYTPRFELAGLGVTYGGGGLTVAGGLDKAPGVTPAEYTGVLAFSFGTFGATAMGSYTTVDGKPSLFAFLFIDYPLGGPPFFFVTGLAGGFGYNRAIQLPAVDQVAAYPLVQGATGKIDQAATETALNAYITPVEGEYWLAAGVAFTSFEMLTSFALVTVAFGTHVEIALMGTSTLSIPVSTKDNPLAPVAQAELELLADFDPGIGQLSVAAQLAPSSYVLSRAAQLTGGFAFYVWFPPSSHRGDFVVTLGGYNPFFTPPSYYPQVPRLGLSWQVSSELTVKGGLYFALTPSVVMAGGSLDANWQSGDVRAWFDAEADFLIRFKPFQYFIDVSISIGVSFKLHLLFTTKSITIQVGVGLALWGPEFGGKARIHLWIISITLSFGADEPHGSDAIEWPEFRDSFLSTGTSAPAPAPALVAGAADASRSTPLTVAAPAGQLGTTQGNAMATAWLVDPAEITIAVGTQVPSKTATVVTKQSSSAPTGTWNTDFGIGPMALLPDALAVSLEIDIDHGESPDEDVWAATAITGNVPTGMWLNTTGQMQSDGLVDGVMTGVTLVPRPPAPDATLPVPVSELLAGDPPAVPFAWSATTVPTTDPFDQSQAMATLQEKLVDTGVATARGAILAALTAQGLDTATSVDVAAYAQDAPDLLASPPLLRVLGEARGA